MIVIVTGSVGTGKTTLSKKLAKQHKYDYLDVNSLIKKKKFHSDYDRKKRCYIVDTKKLNKELIKIIKSSKNQTLIIDSHLSHYLPKKHVDLCIVTKCDLKVLNKRLKKRSYNKQKIRENLDCEIFDICLNEAKEKGHKVVVVDTTKKKNKNYLKPVTKLFHSV